MQTCTPTNFTETKYQDPTSWEKYSNCSPAIQKMKYSTCCKALKDISITWIPGQKKRSSKYLRMDKGIYISTLISTLLTRYKNKVLLSKAAHFLFPALKSPWDLQIFCYCRLWRLKLLVKFSNRRLNGSAVQVNLK